MNGNAPVETGPASFLPEKLKKKLHYWFIQYNPLYFFSALCILFGVFLISKGLPELDWQRGQFLLTAVMQFYEILLIAGSALLIRIAGQYRPAVILTLIEIFFLFDSTFRTEIIATFGHFGIMLSAGWVVIFMIHLFARGIIYDIAMNSVQVAPFYLFWFFSRQKEIWRWVGGFGAIAAASTIPAAVAPCAMIIGIISFLQARYSRRHRLYVASLLSLYIACWTIGWQGLTLPEPKLWLNIVTASALALTCWRLRLFSAIPAVILVLLPGAEKLIPHGNTPVGDTGVCSRPDGPYHRCRHQSGSKTTR